MAAGSFAELLARVAWLEAADRARELVYAYARVLDIPRPETVTALFAPDATITTPSRTARGTDEIRTFFASAFAADPSIKRHFVVNPRTSRLGASRVRVESQFLYTGRDERSVIGWGTYDDVVDVDGERPRFLGKAIVVELSTDLATGWASPPAAP